MSSKPLAYIDGQSVTANDLMPGLIEAAAGTVLQEMVLDRRISRALDDRGLSLTPDRVTAESELILASLSSDPDEAARLMSQMRSRRGLGEVRYDAMLRRNAGLRLMTREEVKVAPALLRQAYDLQYGERYRLRILVAPSMAEATRLLVLAREGAQAFSELAALHSTDPSAAQGGLLSPISLADATYPSAFRQAIKELKPGGVSNLIAVDDRYIIIRLEEVVPASETSYEAALPGLVKQVRRELEAQAMQQAARALLAEGKVVVLDPALDRAWRHRQQQTRSE